MSATTGSTGTITFYATQAEFDSFNVYVANTLPVIYNYMPSNPGGNLSTLRIYQYHDIWTGPGLFDYSPGGIDMLAPIVTWNAANSWWELRVNVTSFGGYFIGTSPLSNLPLTLLTFSGFREGNHNLLKWTTLTEYNNLGFQVERSYDGVHYSSIGFVNSTAANGISSIPLNYTFSDYNIQGDKQYYRLRQIDIGGHEKLTNVVLIRGMKPTILTMSLFPNPSYYSVNVLINSPSHDEVTLLMTDINGKLVKKQSATIDVGSNTIPIDVSRLANGSYLITMVSKTSNRAATTKFVKL
jgi:hypothetical protein